MTLPRTLSMPPGTRSAYHVTSQCVRCLPLFGGKWTHRKDWVCDIAGELLGHFQIELYAYALLTNSLHFVLRPRTDLVAGMDARQIARLGHASIPIRGGPGNAGLPMTQDLMDRLAESPDWQLEYRQRLGSISWFMRCLKQRIAQRANHEDGVLGHFWESRFISAPLPNFLDILAGMACVDAQPHHNEESKDPALSTYASLRARLSLESLGDSAERTLADRLTPLGKLATCDLSRHPDTPFRLTAAQYAQLVRAGCGLDRSLGPAGPLVGGDVDAWRSRLG